MNLFASIGLYAGAGAMLLGAGAYGGYRYEKNAWQAAEAAIAVETSKLVAQRMKEAMDSTVAIANVLADVSTRIAEQKPQRIEHKRAVERANAENPQFASTVVPTIVVGVWDSQAALSRDAEARARAVIDR